MCCEIIYRSILNVDEFTKRIGRKYLFSKAVIFIERHWDPTSVEAKSSAVLLIIWLVKYLAGRATDD